jgi:hypothetical protein
MFIGVSGNAPFLETYWRHIFRSATLPWLVAIRSRIPHSAPMNFGGCHPTPLVDRITLEAEALNLQIKGVRGVYNRAEYAEQRRQMLQFWADYVEALVTEKAYWSLTSDR